MNYVYCIFSLAYTTRTFDCVLCQYLYECEERLCEYLWIVYLLQINELWLALLSGECRKSGINSVTDRDARLPQQQRKTPTSSENDRFDSRYGDTAGKKALLESSSRIYAPNSHQRSLSELIREGHAGMRPELSANSKKLMAAHALLAVGTPPASPPTLSPSTRCGSADSHASSTASSDHKPLSSLASKDLMRHAGSVSRSRSRSPVSSVMSETNMTESKSLMSQDRYSNYDRHFKKKFFGKDHCWKTQTPQQRAIMEERLGKFRNTSTTTATSNGPSSNDVTMGRSLSPLSSTSTSFHQVTPGVGVASHLSAFRPAVTSRSGVDATQQSMSPTPISSHVPSLHPNPFLKLGIDSKGLLVPPTTRVQPTGLCNGMPTLDLNGFTQPRFSEFAGAPPAPSFSLSGTQPGLQAGGSSSSTPAARLLSDLTVPQPAGRAPFSTDPPIFGSVGRHGKYCCRGGMLSYIQLIWWQHINFGDRTNCTIKCQLF